MGIKGLSAVVYTPQISGKSFYFLQGKTEINHF